MQATAAQYDSALLLYGRALQLQPNDMAILNAAKRVAQLSNRDAMRKFIFQISFMIQIILNVNIVCAFVHSNSGKACSMGGRWNRYHYWSYDCYSGLSFYKGTNINGMITFNRTEHT